MRKVADIHAHVFPEKLADKAPASISAFYGGMEVACHPATPQKMAFYEQEAGITRFVMDRAQPDDALVQSAIAAAPEASAVGALFLDRAAGSMQPVVFVRETGSCVAETSCASGSVATAVVLTADFGDGITEIGIGQPGGTLEVGVQRAHGAVTGLSIGGPVRLAQTLTVALADAPC